MKSFAKKLQRFLASEDGPTAVEYAVMLALIVIVAIVAYSPLMSTSVLAPGQIKNKLWPR